MPTKAKSKRKTLSPAARLDKKKALIFAAAFGLVGGAVIWRSFAVTSNGQPVLYLSPASQTVTVSNSFNVQLRVLNQNNSDTSQSNVGAYISYPPDLLTANSISFSGSTFGFQQYSDIDNSSGTLDIEASGSNNLPPNDFLVATINFTAKAAGDAPVTLEYYSHYDVYGPPELQNADFTISSPAPPAPPPTPPASGGSTGSTGSSGSSSGSTSKSSGSTSSGTAKTSSTPAATTQAQNSSPADSTPATTATGTPKSQAASQITPIAKATGSSKTTAAVSNPSHGSGKVVGAVLVSAAGILALVGFGLLARKSRGDSPPAHKPAKEHHAAPPPIPPKAAVKAPEAAAPMITFGMPPPSDPYAWMPKPKTAAHGQHKSSAGAADDNYVEPEDIFAEGEKRLSQEGIGGQHPGPKK